jgi:UDP-N-acetyl-D-glucosamine dehydrogenase
MPLTREVLQRADCVVVVTDHRDIDWGGVAALAPVLVDARNALKEFKSNGRVLSL